MTTRKDTAQMAVKVKDFIRRNKGVTTTSIGKHLGITPQRVVGLISRFNDLAEDDNGKLFLVRY